VCQDKILGDVCEGWLVHGHRTFFTGNLIGFPVSFLQHVPLFYALFIGNKDHLIEREVSVMSKPAGERDGTQLFGQEQPVLGHTLTE
jgi:hypothetical protein